MAKIDRAEAIDIGIGQKVRQLRTALGVTQKILAGKIGISYQQMQKYETGQNRMSAGRLAHIAEVLEVPVEFFFVGKVEGAPFTVASDRLQLEFSKNFSAIISDEIKSDLAGLVKSIVKAQNL